MLLAALAAALIAQEAPAAAPPATDAPTSTAPSTVAATTADTPSGAPSDDFGFVNWCKGALTGHMELHAQVAPELARVEAEKAAAQDAKLTGAALATAKAKRRTDAAEDTKIDAAQALAGRDYLALYTRAIAAAEKAGGEDLPRRADAAQEQGYRIWSAARAAPGRTKMWSWLMWELPARCETSAKKLESQSDLFGAAFKSQAAAAPAPDTPVAAPVDAAAPAAGADATPPPAAPSDPQ